MIRMHSNKWPALITILFILMLIGCHAKADEQQLQDWRNLEGAGEMKSGPGLFSGEDGKFVLYSSNKRNTSVKEDEAAVEKTGDNGKSEEAAATAAEVSQVAGQSSQTATTVTRQEFEEYQEFQQWQKEKNEFHEYLEWKKAAAGSPDYADFKAYQQWKKISRESAEYKEYLKWKEFKAYQEWKKEQD